MEGIQQVKATAVKPRMRLLNFRVEDKDIDTLKEVAAQRRTSISSLVRGALVEAGIFKQKEVLHV